MFSNSIVSSKRKKKFKNSVKFNIYKSSDIFDDNLNYSDCDSLDFLKINSLEYRKGLILVFNANIYEIEEILSMNDEFVLVCGLHEIVEFNNDLNSVEISKHDNKYELVCLNKNFPKTYEKKLLKNKSFIIADTLDVYNNFCN